ncbi:hypothetical protein PpBr36_02610 [Pyricularia pennisetigena]|uniref:hypothetical protein n=1 Tax=Pyricularia pennisetigena TaxID=1578925 RepID=UPI001151D92E|nr:hypothetical protein PpBr36_02610 [Pyricularia pennisetigena]TLS30045.1 hypothetical protein PpBr36_02610 [Pyricularia pennisetigena]
MHPFFLLFAVAPVTVLGSNITLGRGSLGGRCCDNGTTDASDICYLIDMNSYGCTDVSNSEKHGCDSDRLKNWWIGRDVVYFVPGSEVIHTNQDNHDLEIGFVACAK